MSINKKGFALLLGMGTSFLLILAGVVLAFVYAIISAQTTLHLSFYFTCVFFLASSVAVMLLEVKGASGVGYRQG